MKGPIYLVYGIENMTGSAHTEFDVPDSLRFIGSCVATNGDHAKSLYDDILRGKPALVLRANTVEQHALKLRRSG